MSEAADSPIPQAAPRRRRWPLYAALAALYLLHNDLWLWHDTRLVLGLPVGLLYHVGFCLVTSAVLAALVRWAWPTFEIPADGGVDPTSGDADR